VFIAAGDAHERDNTKRTASLHDSLVKSDDGVSVQIVCVGRPGR
jgi:hypothetical protein